MGVTNVSVSESVGVNGVQTKQKSTTDGNSSKELQDNFLTLLIAQMKNQDPTNPMDNSQLTSQLAQINTLAGIERLNTTLGMVSGQIDDSLSVNASNMIGKGVMVPGNKILVATSELEGTDNETETITTPFGFELMRDADSVIITILDENGNVVREVDLGSIPAGVSSFTWDGQLNDGTTAPDGSYTFSVNASYDGQKVSSTSLGYSVVYGVINSKVNNKVLLDLGILGSISIDEVRQIL
ncbi:MULTISPECIES: flagellar hook assembly protein FlgD [unclassified Gilliamella]|uniref:flagellar hook assembly protein FlgD n=1 Tax=unclassified Gilliamella TaxID=2685620 RepID=UPI001C6994C0|nr:MULTISPECIES: flagellar hook assembly protein FlgD [unclassified Gilliamella]MCX8575065.1 flagellar hook assembly protein FlgD [Gilliamella sp. B3831]MCX8577447.1 flagellar hook assembly protein FlgD [Gilliamella sp. B3815]MCX8579705.1 flagellar hook assembly protein FlgD [Gilliamella sp. B2717]MCX8588422.1 flagellar hook assembly protein FlgD [Gilliamella sp. B3801]MCX8590310.1 flagellar hook assembly protein FlgD [Gilliamella sp. B3812]